MGLQYTDMPFSDARDSFPTLLLRDGNTAIIADQRGTITVFDLRSMSQIISFYAGDYVGQERLPMACMCLQQPCIEPVKREWYGVATRGGCAILWNIGKSDFIRIYPETHGPVNSVVFAPDGRHLVIGTGYYPLHGNWIKGARLELWRFEHSEPCYVRDVALPGIAADCVAFNSDGTEIVCVAGLQAQDRGFIIVMESESLRPLAITEIPFAMVRSVHLAESPPDCPVMVAGRRNVICFPYWHGEFIDCLWMHKPENEIYGSDYDTNTNELALTDGSIISAVDGRVARKIEPLKGCASIAFRPGGGFVGVSNEGIIRCWNE